MKKVPATLAALAVVMPLSGCQSFINAFNFGDHTRSTQPLFGQADLEEGRRLLADGQYGNAIPALQRAALNRQTAPDAANALGVAYARIGRGDLAERYFRAAVTLSPQDAKFAANLERFYASDLAQDMRTLHAQKEEARKAYTEFAQSESGISEKPVNEERLVTSGGERRKITLERGMATARIALDGAEPQKARVRVRTAEAGDAPVAQTTSVRVRVSGQPVRPRVSARPTEVRIQSSANYPMRVRIGAKSETERSVASGYPMRVSLRAAKAGDSKE
jgi:tetratricopeptide (TPR) repeat protein